MGILVFFCDNLLYWWSKSTFMCTKKSFTNGVWGDRCSGQIHNVSWFVSSYDDVGVCNCQTRVLFMYRHFFWNQWQWRIWFWILTHFHLLDSCYSMATFTQNLIFLFLLAQVGNFILHTLWCMLQCEQLSAQANAKLHAILRRRGSHFGMWVPDCCLTYGCTNGVLTSRMARGFCQYLPWGLLLKVWVAFEITIAFRVLDLKLLL